MIISPGFQCRESPLAENCGPYNRDTVFVPFQLNSANAINHVYDTINLISSFNDTIHSVQGKTFLHPFNTLNLNVQAYKIVNTGSGATLNYANIEFNPLITEGQYQNISTFGINILYNRIVPNNKLQFSLVAGMPGLYLITLNMRDYSQGLFIYEPNNYCNEYKVNSFIPESQQRKQYWDTIGTTTLRLNGNNNFIVANKEETNYFFIKVNF